MDLKVEKIRMLLKWMKNGKAVSPDNVTVEFLTGLFNETFKSVTLTKGWKRGVLVPIFEEQGRHKNL